METNETAGNLETVKEFITTIQYAYDKTQPWLEESQQTWIPNPRSVMKKSVLRTSRRGSIRAAGIEVAATSQCKRALAYSLYGISSYKIGSVPGSGILPEKGGKVFNDGIDAAISTHWASPFIVGNELVKGSDYAREGFTFLPVPQFSQADGSTRKGFAGCWDYFHEENAEIVELKGVPQGKELPNAVGERDARQASTYVRAYGRARGIWVIYLPTDLSTLDYSDTGTYRAFYISREEAANKWEADISPSLSEVLNLLRFVKGRPEWFYRLIEFLGDCGSDTCRSCTLGEDFRRSYTVDANWVFSKK